MELYEAEPEIIFKTFGARQETLLHRAALHRRIEMVEFLLEHGGPQPRPGQEVARLSAVPGGLAAGRGGGLGRRQAAGDRGGNRRSRIFNKAI